MSRPCTVGFQVLNRAAFVSVCSVPAHKYTHTHTYTHCAHAQALRAADKVFGSTVNTKGFKVIKGCGVIQGDGIDIGVMGKVGVKSKLGLYVERSGGARAVA